MANRERGRVESDDRGDDDEARMRRRVMEEMEENRDTRTRRAFNTAGYGDQGPAGIGRVDPARGDEVRRLDRGWERVRREGFDADRDPERIRDRGEGRGGGRSGGGGTGFRELYGPGASGEERARDRAEGYRHEPRDHGREERGQRGGYGGGPGFGRDEQRGQGGYRPGGRVASWPSGENQGPSQGGVDHRGRGPRGYKRSDQRIEEDVNERLTDDPRVDATEIQVEVRDGEVTLSGTVDSREARRRAEDVAESVPGVTYVLNNLRVRQPGGAGYVG